MTIQYHKFGDYYLPNLVIEDTEVTASMVGCESAI